jgi:hypothetical protein
MKSEVKPSFNANGHKIFIVIEDEDYSELRNLFAVGKNKIVTGFDKLYPASIVQDMKELHYKAFFVRRSADMLIADLNSLPQKLKSRIEPPKSDFIVALKDKPEILEVAELSFETRSTWFLAEVYLFELKSFLDFVTTICYKYLETKTHSHTFGKKKDKSTGIIEPGLEFIEILRNNTPKNNKEKTAHIVELFLKHKALWIDQAINLRDTTTHYRTLKTKFTIRSNKLEAPLDEITLFGLIDDIPFDIILNKFMTGFSSLLTELIPMFKVTEE